MLYMHSPTPMCRVYCSLCSMLMSARMLSSCHHLPPPPQRPYSSPRSQPVCVSVQCWSRESRVLRNSRCCPRVCRASGQIILPHRLWSYRWMVSAVLFSLRHPLVKEVMLLESLLLKLIHKSLRAQSPLLSLHARGHACSEGLCSLLIQGLLLNNIKYPK